ncbi:MAG: tRNA (adenosine(37)-N6)-dimethylallyltransferase MiaA [Ruminococcaceae bacterium]|nr:tRNA (adenosine(37)-N6)-dimethylallyltransferase MiaA [Oscillospiraceae bacterium]
MQPLLCIVGPTASGKTALSVALAKELDGEIVSADSMQLYRGMDIGTAKATREERQGIPHYMLDILDPGESYSAAQYAEDARKCVEDILARGKVPIVAGGTGLYLNALLGRIRFEEEERDPAYRQALEAEAEAEGGAGLLARLREVDPESAAKLHENDHKRIIRALESFHATGEPLSVVNARGREQPLNYRPCIIGIAPEKREVLYSRIDRRVNEMIRGGLIEEARALFARPVLSSTARQAIGYKELLPYLEDGAPLEPCVELLKQNTRRYAKRQLTWFRNDPEVHWIWYDQNVNFRLILQNSREIFRDCVIMDTST